MTIPLEHVTFLCGVAAGLSKSWWFYASHTMMKHGDFQGQSIFIYIPDRVCKSPVPAYYSHANGEGEEGEREGYVA